MSSASHSTLPLAVMFISFKLDLISGESKVCSRTEYLWVHGPAALTHTKGRHLSSSPHSLLLVMMCGHVGCRASKSAFQVATGQTYGVRNLWGLQEVVLSSASSCCMEHSCVCVGGETLTMTPKMLVTTTRRMPVADSILHGLRRGGSSWGNPCLNGS